MIAHLVWQGLRHGKARFICAAVGMAAAIGTVVFMGSLVKTNAAQAPVLAARAAAPWGAWKLESSKRATPTAALPAAELTLSLIGLTLDYRPNGRVLQGPPMRAVMALAPAESPFATAKLVTGSWPQATAAEPEVVCTPETFRRFGRGTPPALGTPVKFVGEKGTLTARVVGLLADTKLPPHWPGVLANRAAFKGLAGERQGKLFLWRRVPQNADGEILTPHDARVAQGYLGDDQRRMDYARPLLLVASILTALALLVNSLLLSVEANRTTWATLRTVGLTRMGTVQLVFLEALLTGCVGWLVGVLGAGFGVLAWTAWEAGAFPAGAVLDWARVGLTLILFPLVSGMAVLFALRPALAVRPLAAAAQRPCVRRRGMAITFACGFAAFVAVEVWGASLMRAFVPSVEWPDAIVSLLPSGVSSFEIEKLRKLEGVKRISELLPLQLELVLPKGSEPVEKLPVVSPRGRRMSSRNALFLAAEWLPEFRFLEGTHADAQAAIRTGEAVVITEMMSRAHGLHKGDRLRVKVGREPAVQEIALPIAGVVDLNWHMVTSRGLVRGLNGASGMTDGPVFASFDTVESLDFRPAPMVRMTHLWVEYEPAFRAQHGVFVAGRKVEAAIAAALGYPSEATVRLHARDEIADGTLAHGSDVIGQVARVPYVFLWVLAIGFIAMLVAETDARQHEFAVLRAVGATRGQVAACLAWTALKIAFRGIVAAIPVGALAGWLFAGHTGNWPGLPHYFVFPVRVVLEGAVGALVVALLFAVPTAVSLVRKRV